MDEREIELIPMFEQLEKLADQWKSDNVLDNTVKLGNLIKPQLKEFSDGKYRSDRNEVYGFFESIEKFRETKLPIDLDFFKSLILKYKRRILPYPHYSGIKVKIPVNLDKIADLQVSM